MLIKSIVSFVLLIIIFEGCAPNIPDVPNEEKITGDISNYFLNEDFPIEKNLTIDNLTIVKRQSSKEEKVDTVYCEIISNDTQVKYYRKYILYYKYYDQGWMLDNVEPYDNSTWTSTPLSGVQKDQIIELFNKQNVLPDEVEYKNVNYDEIDVIRQDTNLEGLTDNITVSLKEDSSYLMINGTINLLFTFNQMYSKWFFTKCTVNSDYKEGLNLIGKWEATSIHPTTDTLYDLAYFTIEILSIDNEGNTSAKISFKTSQNGKTYNTGATGFCLPTKWSLRTTENIENTYVFKEGIDSQYQDRYKFQGKFDVESGILLADFKSSAAAVWSYYSLQLKKKS